MGLFDGIESAEIFERGKFLADGFRGILEVKRTLVKDTRKGALGFIVEFEIMANMTPPRAQLEVPDAWDKARNEYPVGSRCTWFQKMNDRTVALPALKAFVSACSGLEIFQKKEIEQQIAPHVQQLLEQCIASPEANPLIGVNVFVECMKVQTKEKGADFTRHDWRPHQPRAL